MIPFILHWPSLFFSKVSNSRKKVLITPGLYFPNYCVTYLPRDISCDFNKCEHVNLRWEWTRVVFKELYYKANNQKIADKKKADYQEGLEKSCADSKAVADGPVGQVLAGPLFLKVKTKFNFTESK